MIEVAGIRIGLDDALDEKRCCAVVARALHVAPTALSSCVLVRRSVDARKKSDVHFVMSFRIEADPTVEERLLATAPRGITVRRPVSPEPLVHPQLGPQQVRPVVVGLGPAGLFCALYLARCGLRPLVVERGARVEERAADVAEFRRTRVLDFDSNIQFGEGGAGTFSDGKLTTGIKNRMMPHVLRLFVEAGAPESILVDAHPHLGSDNLPGIVATLRREIIALGGEVRFRTRMANWELNDGRLTSMTLEDVRTGAREHVPAQVLVLACGHSARDIFELCAATGLFMERKPFSVGVRIEHPQELINRAQWGRAASHPALGAAEYKLAVHLPGGRNVYTFCMCPGGEVVAAASEEGGVVTNGMSDYARAGANANSALLVNVDPSDFGEGGVLAGVALQRHIERAAFRAVCDAGGSPYQAPAQRVGNFLRSYGMASGSQQAGAMVPAPTYPLGVVPNVPLSSCLPSFVCDAIAEALPLFGRRLRGFDDPQAIMTAPETRSSSPVRIRRARDLQARVALADVDLDRLPGSGIFPCGEGPGYAGGIMSAACDGLKVGVCIAQGLASACAR